MTDKFLAHLDLTVYQIYPRSFCDSDGDGIGDLPGIIRKLDHLAELGVNAVWLCPCFKSPNEDNGYDVADYRDIMDEFGTMEDMRQLIAALHSRGMKLILDLVPNHTSSQHRWFRESRKSKDNPYSDYYYWFDTPPNDWQSAFGGSAWQFDKGRQQYYLHSYAVGQPDLNWENPKVVEEMQAVVDFWVEMGADGFRIDVIDQIAKDFEAGNNCFGPRLHEFIRALFGRPHLRHVFTVGESWSGSIEEILRHCAEDRQELVTLFQFDHLEAGRRGKWHPSQHSELTKVRNIIANWQSLAQQEDIIHALFTDNHDNSWLLSRVVDEGARYEGATMLAAMFYLLRGTAFIYQGQEYGAVASRYDSLEDFRDVESINYYNMRIGSPGESREKLLRELNFGSRDNNRRPFAWDGEAGRGFTAGTPWTPFATGSHEINLAADKASDRSVFRFYQQILSLRRQSEAIRRGTFRVLSREQDPYFVYERALGAEKYVVVCNFSQTAEIPVPEGKLLLTNLDRKEGDTAPFRPYETAVYRV